MLHGLIEAGRDVLGLATGDERGAGDGSEDDSENEVVASAPRRQFLKRTGEASAVGVVGAATLSGGATAAGTLCDRARTDDAGLPWDTGGAYGGWGGADYFDTDGGVSRTPTVFVHGNTGDACNFSGHADYLRARGWSGDELWSITFREATSSHADMAEQLDDFVANVRAETGASSVNLVSHSLGVTGTRVWMEAYDRFDWVEEWVGLAGANHGVCNCPGCVDTTVFGSDLGEPCQFIAVQCFGLPGHPLYEINLPTETPGDVTYHTVRGYYDALYYCNVYSPYLSGADNNLVFADHLGVLESSETKELVANWVA
jgi:pimeloyl-ACP methyl ester carboxylesterase